MNLLAELDKLQTRMQELETQLADPGVFSDQKKSRTLSEEYARLKEVEEVGNRYANVVKEIQEAEQDPELRQLAGEEITSLKAALPKLEEAFTFALIPPDPLDKKNSILEIRAGTGGDEAGLFAVELLRMYTRYAERNNWKVTLISSSHSDAGGIKEAICAIAGKDVYSRLKYESGVHRVQRVPETEKAGRVHTSTATVAILPEAEDIDVKLEPKDLKIEASTAGGHGGQSVNTTYSAIRMTHLPTGITVSCQDERSQQQNRERAMQIMRARVFARMQEEARKEREAARRGQIGTGERSEKIRTYNFPQDRVTDHRIKDNFHNIPALMDGDLDPIINALKTAERAEASTA